MEEIDARLVEAEHVKATWTPVQDLIIDSLSEQIDELKVTAASLLRPLDKNFFPLVVLIPHNSQVRRVGCKNAGSFRSLRTDVLDLPG